MPDRKRRKSAAAMMMVAGGLAAAVTAPIESATAQKGDALPLGQGTAEVQCDGFLPPDFSVVGRKLFFIGKDGTKTKAPDGRWQSHDRRVIIVQNGIIISGALPQGRTTEVQCNGFLPADFSVVGNKLYLVGKDGSKTVAPDGRWIANGGSVFIVENGVIVSNK